jgi:hypothetical protein
MSDKNPTSDPEQPNATSPQAESTATPVTSDTGSQPAHAAATPVDAEPVTVAEPVAVPPAVTPPVAAPPVVAEPAADVPPPAVAPAAAPPALVEPTSPYASGADYPRPVVIEPGEEDVASASDAHPVTAETAVVAPAAASATEPFVATSNPASTQTAAPDRVVYVEAVKPPRKQGNRGGGTLIALISTVLYGAVYAIVTAIIYYVVIRRVDTDFLTSQSFIVPVVFFAVGFILVVLIVNRAGWWAHVVGSLFVALFVYFGSIATILLLNNVVAMTAGQALEAFTRGLANPLIIAAALVAREVALWMGAVVSARGRRIKAKNVEAKAAFERDSAEQKAEHERTGTQGYPAA